MKDRRADIPSELRERPGARQESLRSNPACPAELFCLAGSTLPLRRRNSNLSVEFIEQKPVVRKTYHGEYTAEAEGRAYQQLAGLCDANPYVRLPEVYGVEHEANTIHIEYIRGIDLRRTIRNAGFAALVPFDAALMQLFTEAKAEGSRFDSDPANFIVCQDGSGLVLVDPLCKQLELPDFVFVVFLFGLFKASLTNPLRPRVGQCLKLLDRYCGTYCNGQTGVDAGSIYRQLDNYVQQVIIWNRETVSSESFSRRNWRRFVWIPLLQWFRGWLSRKSNLASR